MYKILLFSVLLFSFLKTEAIDDDSLKNLIHQADIILKVKLENTSADSLPYLVDDLGTNFYAASFVIEKIFKNNTAVNEISSYSFVYYGYKSPDSSLYIQGATVYLFLTSGLPKNNFPGSNHQPVDFENGASPGLLKGGLIPAERINDFQLKKLCRVSSFARAAHKGNTGKMKRMIRRELALIRAKQRFKTAGSREIQLQNLTTWIQSQQGIDGLMAEACVAHIDIYPGWVTYNYWVNTPESMKEYTFSIQLATVFFRRFWADNRLHLKYLAADSGARQRNINYCIQEKIYRQKDVVNNQIQLLVDEGRLNWSVYDAPKHEDSDNQTIRLKLSLLNRSDSAMFVRWPGEQNQGSKLLRFVLQHQESRTLFTEDRVLHFAHDETIGPEPTLLIAGDMLSAWHSINDPYIENTDVCGAHHFNNLPSGTYRVGVIYQPYPQKEENPTCWQPNCDSITAWAAYPFKIIANPGYESFRVKAKVLAGWGNFTNEYGQQGIYNGKVVVLESSWIEGVPVNKTIAWKIMPPFIDEFYGRPRPAYDHELIKEGDIIELDLRKKVGAIDKSGSEPLPIYGTMNGLYSIKRLQ
jgi:hypothetical protein